MIDFCGNFRMRLIGLVCLNLFSHNKMTMMTNTSFEIVQMAVARRRPGLGSMETVNFGSLGLRWVHQSGLWAVKGGFKRERLLDI